MNLIERVTAEMETDYEDTNDQSERLIEAYRNADEAGKALVDTIFVCLCGWQLSSLLLKDHAHDLSRAQSSS